MTIQFNTDNNITGSQELQDPLNATIEKSLSRFSNQITRLEVHLNDENSHKNGQNDIRCMLEARMEGRQPIAVTSNGGTNEQALKGAIDKLTASLETIIGRARNY